MFFFVVDDGESQFFSIEGVIEYPRKIYYHCQAMSTQPRFEILQKGLSFIDLLINSQDIDFTDFLHEMAQFLSESANSTSCLIYVVSESKKSMSLVGTVNNRKKFIEKLVLKEGEGITGWVAKHKKYVYITRNAYNDPRFKFIKGLPEDKYEGFLSLPITLNDRLLGIVNLQYKKPANLSPKKIIMMQSLIHILAYSFSIYVLQREVLGLSEKLESRKIIEKAKGILMKKLNISESEAFLRLRTEAMKQRKKMEELATSIITVEKIV